MESITDLINGYKIYQYENEFKFSVDAVLLAGFIERMKNEKVLEIGGGTGVISILLLAYEKNINSKITILEIQKKMSDLIEKNLEINDCRSLIEVINIDVKNYGAGNSFDTVFSNPPYMEVDGKKINENSGKSLSRHEISLNLEELIKNAKRLLKPIGKFYMVHRAHRLQEIVATLSKYNFNIEKIQFAHHKKGEKANLVLIKANKGIKKKLEIQEPKYISEV